MKATAALSYAAMLEALHALSRTVKQKLASLHNLTRPKSDQILVTCDHDIDLESYFVILTRLLLCERLIRPAANALNAEIDGSVRVHAPVHPLDSSSCFFVLGFCT